jgi:histidinol-phosphatase
MTPQTADTDLNKALHLADLADAISGKYYRSSDLRVETKPDKTPVTEADTLVEETLSKVVHEIFGDAYIGEEGMRDAMKGRYWVIDPIDGTKNFMRGMPVWATLISINDEQGPLATVVSAPALGRRWWAARGKGAWTKDVDGNVRKLTVSGVSSIADASLLHSSIFSWDTVPAGSETMLNLLKSAWRNRGIGDFWGHMLVAEGAADACFEPDPKLWDVQALKLIVTEAGGSFWEDADATTPPESPRIAISSNGKLQDELVAILAKK